MKFTLSNIADHPVVLCAATAMAVLTACTGVTFTWIVPTMVASVENKLDLRSQELEKALSDKTAVEEKNSGLLTQIADLESKLGASNTERIDTVASKDKRIAELQSQLFEAQKSGLFISGSPYPVGFDKVRLGDPVSKITEVYPYKNESESNTRIFFHVPSDVFSWMGFDFNSEKKDVVEAVSLSIGILRTLGRDPKSELPDNWLETTLTRALGEPTVAIGPSEKCLVWRIDSMDKTLVFHRKGDDEYVISRGIAPGGCYITKEQRDKMDAENGRPRKSAH
jgi:hypothetical protein